MALIGSTVISLTADTTALKEGLDEARRSVGEFSSSLGTTEAIKVQVAKRSRKRDGLHREVRLLGGR